MLTGESANGVYHKGCEARCRGKGLEMCTINGHLVLPRPPPTLHGVSAKLPNIAKHAISKRAGPATWCTTNRIHKMRRSGAPSSMAKRGRMQVAPRKKTPCTNQLKGSLEPRRSLSNCSTQCVMLTF